jgi:hypothetical protein
MNDARGYRANAVDCLFAAKFCQPCYRSPLFSTLVFASPADQAIDVLLVVR